MLQTFRKKLIGDKAFYKMVIAVAMPILVQNLITNFVSLLDNIMVGAVGTEQMSGVSIGNQLIFVFNLCIFGGYSGAGIFTAQFHGKKDQAGIASTMRFKMILGMVLSGLAIGILLLFKTPLINLFLHDGSETGDLALTLQSGQEYLDIMLLGLIPFALNQVYTSTLREVGETMLPMKAGVIAVLVNLCFNWLLIYGNLGFPCLGVQGAAIATVLSRFVECTIVIIWTHRHKARFPFIHGIWRSLKIPGRLTKDIILKGMPLLVNETLWSMAVTLVNQSYSTRGLAVVAGINIASTITNLFNVVFAAIGTSVGIVVGNLLGQGKTREAVDTDRKMIAFDVALCTVIGAIMLVLAPLFPELYNTYDEVKQLSVYFIRLAALLMPFSALQHASYFTLRCGGKTILTFFFDCGFEAGVILPVTFCIAHLTTMDIHLMYAICQGITLIKCPIALILLKKGVWINNIVGGQMEKSQ